MLSPATIEHLHQLHAVQNDYVPNKCVLEQNHGKKVVLLVGVSAGGKNTTMAALPIDGKTWAIQGTHTSRPPRDTDDPNLYTYIQNTNEGLAAVFASIHNGEFMQYAVNTHSHTIYGSMPDDYPAEYNVGDVFWHAVEGYRKLGFEHTVVISLVTDPETQLERFKERFPAGHPDRTARIQHAKESLAWSLTQVPGTGHYWVENVTDTPGKAAADILNIARDHVEPNNEKSLRTMARKTLQLFERLRV